MEKLFWLSLPITLMIVYLLFRAIINKPVNMRDINMIFAIYLMFYVFITAGLGLFWVARMDLPAFDLHYLSGYCLLFLVSIHLWFQLPLVMFWLRKNSPSILIDGTTGQWKPIVKNSFLLIIGTIIFSAVTIIVYEFMNPATITIIEKLPDTAAANQRLLIYKGEKISAASYIHQQGDITRGGAFIPRFNIDKPPVFKTYSNYPTVSLPAPSIHAGIFLQEALSQQPMKSIAAMDLQRLSDILYYSYGVTETRNYPGGQLQLRAAASSGALYPNDLYIAAFTVKGLDSGIYYYHPVNHNLIKVGDQASLSLLAAASPDPDIVNNAAAMIMITTYFDRSVWKYHDRSYRYVLLDSGHILGNLTLASKAMHVPYITTSFFDDVKMEKILGLSPENEGVLYMVVLGKKKLTLSSRAPHFKSVALTDAGKNLEITRVLHQLTSVQWEAGSIKNTVTTSSIPDDDIPSTDKLIALPAETATGSDLFSVIKNRRSFRQFSQHDVSFHDFSGIIRDSYAPLINSHNVEIGTRVHLFVIVSHVQDLPKGVYRYIPEKSALQKIVGGDFSTDIYHAGLSQEVLKQAAFVIVWAIDLNSIGQLHGERDYRNANIASGVGSETAYLATEARKLGACAVGAFYDKEVQAILNISGTTKRAILLTAVGIK